MGNVDDFVMIEKPDYFESTKMVNFGGVEIVKENGDLIPLKRLDSYDFKDVIFIKIDVQGYESFVIDGAKDTIKKHRPYLFVEFEDHLLKKQGTSEDELKLKIESLGYVVLPFQEGIPYQSYSGKCLDYVGIPKEKFDEFNHIIP
jgi:hypothetical protein